MTDEPPKLRILLAEDSEPNRQLIVRALSKRGHEVVVANDGREAVELATDQSFDGILMDCQMPVMDGFEATAAIRRLDHQRGRELIIIGFTAETGEEERRACLAAGMNEFIPKPISVAELREKVVQWFGPKRTDDV